MGLGLHISLEASERSGGRESAPIESLRRCGYNETDRAADGDGDDDDQKSFRIGL